MPNNNRQQGFSAIYVSFLVAFSTLAISVNVFLVASNSQRIVANNSVSLQVLYTAESGVEDAAYRIGKNKQYTSPYTFPVGQGTSTVSLVGQNTKTITSKGQIGSITRNIQAVMTINAVTPQFFYGVQVGEGGVVMGGNSRVEGTAAGAGNLYSQGPVTGANGATITGDITVAGTNSIDNVIVYGTARANTITNSKICGDAYYKSTTSIDASSKNFLDNPFNPSCGGNPLTSGTGFPNQSDPQVSSMPISQANIDRWKTDASTGGTISGNYSVTANTSLGPKKITGDLLMTSSNKTLTVTGTIHVQGNIDIDNGSRIQCAASYGTNSCVVVADGWIHVSNNGVFAGSGQQGSYSMLFTTVVGCNGGTQQGQCTHHNAAIDLHNNAVGAIFYVQNSMARLHNGVNVSEVTAYKLELGNNAIVTYEQGLVNAQFSSGPGASWDISSWKEVE